MFLEILWPWFEECFRALSATHDPPRGNVHYPIGMDADFRFKQENEPGPVRIGDSWKRFVPRPSVSPRPTPTNGSRGSLESANAKQRQPSV